MISASHASGHYRGVLGSSIEPKAPARPGLFLYCRPALENPNIGYNRTASDEKTDWEKSHARDRSCFAQYHSCDGDRSPRSGEGEAGAIGARPARLSVVGATRLLPRLPSE